MALIKCPECGNEVSDKAAVCPNCGVAISTIDTNTVAQNVNPEICPECGNEIDPNTRICGNCGYNPINILNKKKQNKKKLFVIIGIIAVIIVIVLSVVLIKKANKGTTYVVKACKALAEDESGLPDIKKIYISEKADVDFSTIHYAYRVYIEYSSGWDDNAVMYIVDDEGETYYITKNSNKKLSCYLSIAKTEIYGLEGLWGPSGDWQELSTAEILKIEKKVK